MANVYWKGGAVATAQVTTFTPTDAPDAGDTTTLQAIDDEGGDYTLSVTGVGSVKDLVEAFVTAATAAKTAGYAPWDEVTATENDTVLTLTVTTAGKPINFVGTAGAGETFTEATPTPNSGPYDWGTLANWIDADGAIADNLPGADASDTVYVEGDGTTNPVIKYGLDQSGTAETITALYATKCQIGSNGSAGFAPNYLKIKASKIEINYSYIGTATYSSPININNGTVATTINVYNSGTNNPTTEPSVNLKVVESSSDIYVHAGKVGIASHAGEVSTVDNIYVLGSAAYAYIGAGVTTTGGMIEQRAGYCYSMITVATIPLINIYGGSFYQVSNSTVTITALNSIGGTTDLTGVTGVVTVTTWKAGINSIIKYDIGMATLTSLIQPYETTGKIQYSASAV
jgi:hypothetical protein